MPSSVSEAKMLLMNARADRDERQAQVFRATQDLVNTLANVVDQYAVLQHAQKGLSIAERNVGCARALIARSGLPVDIHVPTSIDGCQAENLESSLELPPTVLNCYQHTFEGAEMSDNFVHLFVARIVESLM